MTSKFGFQVVTPREPTPREREEQRRRDAGRQFQKARNKIVAILRDYNAARQTNLSVDPQTYFVDGELVMPQQDSESLHLALVLHEQTGLDVRVTQRAGGVVSILGHFDRPEWVIETVKLFSSVGSESVGKTLVSETTLDASVSTETARSVPEVEERRIAYIGTRQARLRTTAG